MRWIAPPFSSFAIALGLGLLIGLERERSKGAGPSRGPAGVRTFSLASLLGAIALHLGGVLLLALVTAGVAAVVAVSHLRARGDDPGLTTEIALVLTPLVGALALRDAGLASAVGVSVAILLAAKAPLHAFATKALTQAETSDMLVFAAATLVVFPQLPDCYLGPFEALNPHSIWMLIILILAVGALGHIADRALGPRFGLPLAGFAAGFASSTATIGSMAGLAAREPSLLKPAVAAAALSTVATFIQMGVVLAAVSAPVLRLVAPGLLAGGCVAALYGAAAAARAFQNGEGETHEPGRAFSVATALALAATMAVMLVAAAGLKQWFGEAGIAIGAAAAGFVDTHSAAISVASLAAGGKFAPADAVLPIGLAMTSNAASKAVMAFAAGRRDFLLRLLPGLALAIAAFWAALLI